MFQSQSESRISATTSIHPPDGRFYVETLGAYDIYCPMTRMLTNAIRSPKLYSTIELRQCIDINPGERRSAFRLVIRIPNAPGEPHEDELHARNRFLVCHIAAPRSLNQCSRDMGLGSPDALGKPYAHVMFWELILPMSPRIIFKHGDHHI